MNDPVDDAEADIRHTAQPAVMKTVKRLRADALDCEKGALIGSEEDLVGRYNVSRPTLRQAAVIVAQEQLLQVRRGVGGGYIAARPHFSAVTHIAAIFLQTKGTRLREILVAIEPIRLELVRAATLNADEAARAEIREFLQVEEERRREGYSYRYFLWAERRWAELLGRASGSTVLNLFLRILIDLLSVLPPEEDILIGRVERIAATSAQRMRVIRAVLSGDVEVAMLEAQRSALRGTEWIQQDKSTKSATRSQKRRA